MKRALLLSAALALVAAAPAASAAPATYDTAIAAPDRPEADRARDADRRPAAMLAFAGIRPGMTVVEILPGGGYFTRLFSAAVGPTGKVIGYVPDEVLTRSSKAGEAVQAIATDGAHPNVQFLHDPMLSPGPEGIADVVWTSQNYHDLHNLPGADLVGFNRVMYRALKPGGLYVILDHAAAPGSGLSATSTLHRIDPAVVRQEVEAAGFRFVGESKVLANPADDHKLRIFDPSLRGHTDQFVYKFRKPK